LWTPNSVNPHHRRISENTSRAKAKYAIAGLIAILIIQILPGVPSMRPSQFFTATSQSSLYSIVTPVLAQRVATNSTCNCTLDTTTYGHLSENVSGITIPKVRIVQNQSLQSQTEGHLTWKAIKPMQLMGILTNGFFLGNFSSGTASTVALNSLNVKPNDSIGIQIGGGTIPTTAKAELVKADIDVNGTLAQIKTVGKPISTFDVNHGKNMKMALAKNKLLAGLDPHPNNYLLLMSLTYDDGVKSAGSAAIKGLNKNLIVAMYETVLQVG
jgi:hypothetical protein